MAVLRFLVLILTIILFNGKSDGQNYYPQYDRDPYEYFRNFVSNHNGRQPYYDSRRSDMPRVPQSYDPRNQNLPSTYQQSHNRRTQNYRPVAPQPYDQRIRNLQPTSEQSYNRRVQNYQPAAPRSNFDTPYGPTLNSGDRQSNRRRIHPQPPPQIRGNRHIFPPVGRGQQSPSQGAKSQAIDYTKELQNTNFCNVKACKNHSYSMCKYKSPLEVNHYMCGEVKSSSLTPKEKQDILNKHNELRRKVARGEEKRGKPGPQPAAATLKDLKWNDELANLAQTWANQCIDEHSCQHTDNFRVGQNMGYNAWSDGYHTITEIVQSWYDEVENFDSREVKKYRGAGPDVTTHYTQLIWEDTTEVGCGAIRFKHPEFTKGYHRTQLICNYAPGGNMIGSVVYKTR